MYEDAPFGKALKLSVDPAQRVELLEAVGVTGIGFTVTLTVPAELVQPCGEVLVTEYTPVARVVAPAIVGF